MSPPNQPYTITFLPPPGPAVFSLPTPDPALCLIPSPSPSPSAQPTSSQSPVPQPFHDAIAVRVAVFVTEQHVPVESEIDPDDPTSFHWILYTTPTTTSSSTSNTNNIPAATIRLVPTKTYPDPVLDAYNKQVGIASPTYAHSELWDGKEPFLMMGRLATRREFRGRGFARTLIEEAVTWASTHKGDVVREWRDERGERVLWRGLFLAHAQVDKEGWYEGMGWRTDEGLGRWDECGIWHVGMWKRVVVEEG